MRQPPSVAAAATSPPRCCGGENACCRRLTVVSSGKSNVSDPQRDRTPLAGELAGGAGLRGLPLFGPGLAEFLARLPPPSRCFAANHLRQLALVEDARKVESR